MKLLLALALSCSVIVADLACMVALVALDVRPVHVVALLTGHGSLAVLGSTALLLVMPRGARRQKVRYFAFCTLYQFFLPVLGNPGLLLVMTVGLRKTRPDEDAPWHTVNLEESFESKPKRKESLPSEARLARILQDRRPEKAEARFEAILQAYKLPARAGIRLFRLALKDPSDEVRLFAFTRIEKMRDELETNIKSFIKQLETAHEDDRALISLRLGESYWEIAYLELAEGAVLDHALRNARRYIEEANRLRPNYAPAQFRLGRILMRLGDRNGAYLAFELAIRAGYSYAKAAPYLAECAFELRRYDRVRRILRDGSGGRAWHGVMRPVVEFWQ